MRMVEWFREKWIDRVRQFGVVASLIQIMKIVIRPVYRNYGYFILAIRDRQPNLPTAYPEIGLMTAERVEHFMRQGAVTQRHERDIKKYLAQGCQGFIAEIDGRLAGYAFIQPAGECSYGYKGRFQIPSKMMLLRWLFVFSEFRGHSLGKKLNQVRIGAIPADQTPIVFVITENRYAIRNLKMYGFEEILKIQWTTWFKKWSAQRIKVLIESDISRRLIEGFTALNDKCKVTEE
jgi:hypothetical protein